MKLFNVGKQFPDEKSIKRLSKYIRGKSYFDGNAIELYERATDILKDTPHAEKLKLLYIACNIIDPLTTKPSDMMFGEPPTYESGKPDDSEEQKALNRLVEENDLNQLGHELVLGSGIRGDGWIKVTYDYRHDYTEYKAATGREAPEGVQPEVLIELVPAQFVYPEVSKRNRKKFTAINIAYVEFVDNGEEEIPYLNVERHIPGYIFFERYKLAEKDVDNSFDAKIQVYDIIEQVSTGREENVVETGLPFIPLFHMPYKSIDDDWPGVSNIEKVESLLSAINDRLAQIDYVLWKHSDPMIYVPTEVKQQLQAEGNKMSSGGRIFGLDSKDSVIPGYMEWNSQLEAAFKELDRLVGAVFLICETPQWIFGTTITETDNAGGTGTSHTDGAGIKSRFMPILSKVKRIRVHADQAIRDALWAAQLLEQYVREKYETNIPDYEPQYPKIIWKDGLPRNEKELAETMEIRINTGTIDKRTAIKVLENADDVKANMIYDAVQAERQEAIEQMQNQMSVDLGWNQEEQEVE